MEEGKQTPPVATKPVDTTPGKYRGFRVRSLVSYRGRWKLFFAILAPSLIAVWVFWSSIVEIPAPEVWNSFIVGIVGYLGFHMSAHPPKEQQKLKTWMYKAAFVVTAIIIIGLTFVQRLQNTSERETEREAMQKLREQDRKTMQEEMREIRRVQKEAWDKITEVMRLIATTRSDPKLLSSLAYAAENLRIGDERISNADGWAIGYTNRLTIKAIRKDQTLLEERQSTAAMQRQIVLELQPVWLEIVHRLKTNLQSVAKDYYGGKSTFTNDLTVLDKLHPGYASSDPSWTTNLVMASMSLGTNEAWKCTARILANTMMNEHMPADFIVECKGTNSVRMHFARRGAQVETILYAFGKEQYRESFPISGYGTNVISYIDDLFGVQKEEFETSGTPRP